MKYCAKCGAQIADEAIFCPQCQTPTNNQHSPIPQSPTPQKRKPDKTVSLLTINIILTAILLVTIFVMYSFPPLISDFVSNSSGSVNSNVFNSSCPEDEHGNHDWSSPTCSSPAKCYECGAYRDDKLGQHSFYTHDDGLCDCSYCGILYEVYIDSLG